MNLRSLIICAAAILSATAAIAQPAPMQRIPKSDPNGAYCREYQQVVIIGGKRQNSYGTACMQPDGDWKILPSEAEDRAYDTTVEYVTEPVYISEPVYVVPPPAYYDPYPYYGPYYRPYARSGISFHFGSSDYHHGHRRGHWRGHGHRHH